MSTCELKTALESSDQLDFENYLDNRETHQIIADIKAIVGEKQAQIDRLMMEFCPDEMSPRQVREWEQNQRLAGKTLSDLWSKEK
ncbi:MAG: hypothetical protein M0R02_12970 [Bacteroidales bacterium]|nr:hypothetical protein [Bacteroidales bacterium]